jgi:peptide/nickel transport system substrate-binding protein
VPTHPFNPARAAALLAAVGFVKGPDGVLQKQGQPFELTLWTGSSDDIGQRINQVLQQAWGQLGVQVTLRTMDGSALYSASGPYFVKAMAGVTTVNGNNPDPDDWLNWISAGIPASPSAATCCNDLAYFHRFAFQAQIDALYQAGNSTLDPARRRATYVKIQALLADEVPVIFLYWTPELMLIPGDLTGFAGNPFYPVLNEIANWRRG